MRIGISGVLLLSFVALAQCDNPLTLLEELKSLDFMHLIEQSLKNLTDFEKMTHSELTGRTYDWDKCLLDLGDIIVGLRKTEWWAMQLVDSWGKIPSGVLTGNLFEMGSFTECLNLQRDGAKYNSQYCPISIAANISSMMPGGGMQTRMNMPTPGTNEVKFGLGMCFPQSCAPKDLSTLVNRVIPANIKKKVTVLLVEQWCQVEETPSDLRTIDWITIGLLSTVLCLMIASTLYDIYCSVYERPKVKIFMAFSVYTNGRSLLSTKKSKSKDMMDCVHGIRAFSTQWVVLGHTYIMYMLLPTRNTFEFMPNFVKQYHSMYLMSAFISVDTFFMLSGLFQAYTMLKHFENTKGRINIPVLYLHRFLRLTPLLAVAVLITVSILRYASSGPQWPIIVGFVSDECERNWWKTLLYIQNYVDANEICLAHSWYLAVDTQLFLISPIVVFGIYRFGGKFLYLLSTFLWLCVIGTIVTYVNYDFATGAGMPGHLFAETYVPTQLRFSPWLVGVIFGAILFESRKRTIRIPAVVNLVAWLVTFGLMATVVFGNYPFKQPEINSTTIEYAMYDSLSRIAWSLALSYIIFACVHGYGGPVNWFLSLTMWQPLSRLSYAIYILHFHVIFISMASAKTSFVISEFSAYHNFLGNYVLTILASIVASLAFETPIVIIEKIIFGDGKKNEQRKEPPKQSISDEKV